MRTSIYPRALTSTWLISLVMFSSCEPLGRNRSNDVKQNRVEAIQASLNDTGDYVKQTKSQFPESESFLRIQFIDVKRGWLGSRYSLFKTSDGGMTWFRVPLKIPKGTSLRTFRFRNFESGWIVFQKHPQDSLDYNGSEYGIMHTGTGGRSWILQYSGVGGQLDQLQVLPQDEVWAAGREFSERNTTRNHPMMIHTADEGQHWINDESLSQTEYGLTALAASKPSGVIATTVHGTVLKTDGFGTSWKEIAAIEDEPQTFFGQLGQTDDGQLWLLGGADSLEGAWGVLAKQTSHNSWIKYRADAYLSAALFITAEKIVACGHIVVEAGTPPSHQRKGIVLLSLDGGLTWKVIYKDSSVSSIKELETVERNVVWAVGDKGFVVRLDIP